MFRKLNFLVDKGRYRFAPGKIKRVSQNTDGFCHFSAEK